MPQPRGNPLVYEINTRCWLGELSARLGSTVSLGQIPEDELDRLARLGFTHVWLMGVWKVGPRSRAHSLDHFKVHRGELHCTEEEIHGSTFAIAGYAVEKNIGGEEGLRSFRQQLHQRHLKLLLDFIPNHVGLDHPWLDEEPRLFVHSSKRLPGMFHQHSAGGKVFIAHGKDPYFPPWTDTAQLDYRNPETRARMQTELMRVADLCDGVRCDMAMLILNEVFERNWDAFASPFPRMEKEFWEISIPSIKKAHPDFIFLAEAYWGLEPRLQQLGFDYAYLKTFYDHVMARRFGELHSFLHQPRELLDHGAYFLENHDEERVARNLAWPEHQAAALLLIAMPGLRLLHEGQLEGLVHRVSVHLGARRPEKPPPETASFYNSLLVAVQRTSIGVGECSLLDPIAIGDEAGTPAGLFLIQWQSEPDSFDLVVVNLSMQSVHCRAACAAIEKEGNGWISRSVFSSSAGFDPVPFLKHGELSLIVQPHHAQVLAFRRSA